MVSYPATVSSVLIDHATRTVFALRYIISHLKQYTYNHDNYTVTTSAQPHPADDVKPLSSRLVRPSSLNVPPLSHPHSSLQSHPRGLATTPPTRALDRDTKSPHLPLVA